MCPQGHVVPSALGSNGHGTWGTRTEVLKCSSLAAGQRESGAFPGKVNKALWWSGEVAGSSPGLVTLGSLERCLQLRAFAMSWGHRCVFIQ